MVLEKKSFDAIAVFFGLVVILLAMVSFSLDYTGWLFPAVAILGGLILIFELNFKKANFIPIHNLKNWGTMQYITMIIAALSIIVGIVNIPSLYFAVAQASWFKLMTGFVLLMVGLFIIIEWYSNKK